MSSYTCKYENGNYGIEMQDALGTPIVFDFTPDGVLIGHEYNCELDIDDEFDIKLPFFVSTNVNVLLAQSTYNKRGLNALNSMCKHIGCDVSVIEFGFGKTALERKKDWLDNTENNILRVHYYGVLKSSKKHKSFKGNLIRGKEFVFNK